MTDDVRALNPVQRVQELTRAHDAVDKIHEPDRWALSAYHLAVAESEIAGSVADLAVPLQRLRAAARMLDERRAPVEHGRILTVLASCQRRAGDLDGAVANFTRAADLLVDRVSVLEQATAWSNLGQTLTEIGRVADAVMRLDRAVAVLDTVEDHERSPAWRRVALVAHFNRGLAHQSAGLARLDEAAHDYEFVTDHADPNDEPLHLGMAYHGLGTVAKARGRFDDALAAFDRAARVLSVVSFPFQHAVCRYNRALTLETMGDLRALQWALAEVSVALSTFDQRLHRAAWETALQLRTRVVRELAVRAPGLTWADHEVAVVASLDPPAQLVAVRELLGRAQRLPQSQRRDMLVDVFEAVVLLDSYGQMLPVVLDVLMELPESVLADALGALVWAHGEHPDTELLDIELDRAVHDKLHGPQRVRVRDLLVATGWNRP